MTCPVGAGRGAGVFTAGAARLPVVLAIADFLVLVESDVGEDFFEEAPQPELLFIETFDPTLCGGGTRDGPPVFAG